MPAGPEPGRPPLERELARQGERLIISRGPRVGDSHGPGERHTQLASLLQRSCSVVLSRRVT